MNRAAFPFATASMFRMAAGLSVFLMMASCGGKQPTSVPSSSTSSTGTGSISFAVTWEPPPDPTLPGGALNLFPATAPKAHVDNVCEDYAIDTIVMQVIDNQTLEVRKEGTFPCTAHRGALTDVPTGNNLKLRLFGRVTGTEKWTGTSTIFNLAAGGSENLGQIAMAYTYTGPGADTQPPSVSSTFPVSDSQDMPPGTGIKIAFSESMARSAVEDNALITVMDNAAVPNRISGSILYNPLDNSAQFAPSGSFTGGVTYSVTLDSSMTDMAGRPMAAPYQWNFSTHVIGTWEKTFLIDSGLSSSRSYIGTPSGVIDKSGNVVAAWRQEELTPTRRYRIYSNIYIQSTRQWDTPVPIDEGIGTIQSFAGIGTDNTGHAMAVWCTSDASGRTMRVKPYTADSGWQPLYDTGTSTYKPASTYKIVMNKKGSTLVPYLFSQPTGSYYLALAIYTGGSWNDHWVSTNRASKPAAAINGKDNAVVLWLDDDGISGILRIKARRYIDIVNRIWVDEPLPLDNNTPSTAIGDISTAMDDNGNVVVVWNEYYLLTPNQSHIWTNRYDVVQKKWGGPSLLESDSSGLSWHPRIAVDGNGNFTAVWYNASDRYVYARRYVGGAWGSTIPISSVGSTYPNPEVTANESGDVVAAWWAAGWRVGTNRYVPGTGWGPVMEIPNSALPSAPANLPEISLAINEDGTAAAVWTIPDQTPPHVGASRYW